MSPTGSFAEALVLYGCPSAVSYDIIVVVTGDSDLVPAFRFARREGVRVFLDHMGHGVRGDLKAHADTVI